MKSQFVALAILLGALPALAWGQGSCGCTSRVSSRTVPASYGAWAEYQPAGHHDGGCNSCTSSCAPSCCTPCCGRQILCIIPNTVKKIGCVLDCLVPRGPICCSSCGSPSCTSCTSICPSCSSAVGNPFQDDVPMPPLPKPAPQETRRQLSPRTTRDYAAAPAARSKVATSRPATKSVLTRSLPAPVVVEEISRANHTDAPAKKPAPVVKRTSATSPLNSESTPSSRSAASSIPHNPLR